MISTWLKDSKKGNYPKLSGKSTCDVVIVGGGISGISLALELAKSGNLKIMLLEQNELYHGVTGFTTGKVTVQHGYKYQDLIKTYGKDCARLYYEANLKAITIIEQNISEYQIDCNYHKCSHSLCEKKETVKLKKEKEAYQILGIPFKEESKENYFALTMEGQAVFHIVKYLDGLLKKLKQFKNVEIYEHSKVIKEINSGKVTQILGEEFSVSTKKVVYTSFYPQYGKFNLAFLHLKPVLSFVCDLDTKKHISNSFIYAENPIFSCRPLNKNNMLFAGFSVAASKNPSYLNSINSLKSKANDFFEVKHINECWVNEDYDSLDYLPLIGQLKNNCYIMAGFNKWGITTSVIGAKIISDLIVNCFSEYEDLYNPRRTKCLLKKVLYSLHNPVTLVLSFFKVKKIKTCSHMHCALRKNDIDNTLDCPCHGSKFDSNGKVIIGPARNDIKRN